MPSGPYERAKRASAARARQVMRDPFGDPETWPDDAFTLGPDDLPEPGDSDYFGDPADDFFD